MSGLIAHEYEAMQDRLELLTDVQLSLNQLENGEGMAHEDAKERVLKRVKKKIDEFVKSHN